jgi:hypothetical protein
LSQLYVSGPTGWFTQTGASAGWEFLGFCEGDTRITLDGGWEDVMVDATGTRVPFDVQYMGDQAYIGGDLVLHNELVWQRVAARLGPNPVTGDAAGVYLGGPAGAIGSLMRSEGYAYGLVIRSIYGGTGGKQFFTSGNMPGGYYFSQAWLDGQFDISLSTKRTVKKAVFRAIPAWNIVNQTFMLATTTLPTLPAIN